MKTKNPSHVLLGRCPFCGLPNCIAHKKYTDRCEECGKRYTKYSNYKSLQRSNPTFKRQLLLDKIIDEYKDLKHSGYRVPRDIT
jgi:transposase-like protein